MYIADSASKCAVSTITRRLTAITKAHQAAGYPNSPSTTKHFIVGETMKGIRRIVGTAQHGLGAYRNVKGSRLSDTPQRPASIQHTTADARTDWHAPAPSCVKNRDQSFSGL
jgi:hypothetical protein